MVLPGARPVPMVLPGARPMPVVLPGVRLMPMVLPGARPVPVVLPGPTHARGAPWGLPRARGAPWGPAHEGWGPLVMPSTLSPSCNLLKTWQGQGCISEVRSRAGGRQKVKGDFPGP